MERCLMIRTNDKRKFFTKEENFPQLIEFSKTFKAEISLVKAENAQILDLAELAPALCSPVSSRTPQYELIEIKLPKIKKTRKNILAIAYKIKKYIKEKFLSGEIVSLKDLKKKFKKYNLTTSCLCHHINITKAELALTHKIEKIGAGTYKII